MKFAKKISAVLFVTIFCVLLSEVTYAKGIVNDGIGIRYQLSDGTFAKNCRRVENGFAMHFNENGYMDASGFDALKGNWKNTKKGKRYMFEDGRIPVGGPWLFADGQYYTFDDNGYLLNDSNKTKTSTNTSKTSTTTSKTNKTTNTTTKEADKNKTSEEEKSTEQEKTTKQTKSDDKTSNNTGASKELDEVPKVSDDKNTTRLVLDEDEEVEVTFAPDEDK